MAQEITDEDVMHIAWLCRIKMGNQEEIEDYKQKFNDILNYFRKINEIDTDKIEPTFHIIKDTNRFREDIITESLSEKEIMQNVPKKKDKFIVAPKIA
ncbi:MAG: Asp-tRNA(Asn)/Glu-tRNA(Gln) amidotransferase subunit GatC [Candidatus Helarchaeota archaeon]